MPEDKPKKRWIRRPDASNWGEFGDDDQLGRVNLIDRQKVLQGIAEVKEGLTFCLSLRLDEPGAGISTARHPPDIQPISHKGHERFDMLLSGDWNDLVNDDVVTFYPQYSTQWDSFCHIGQLFDADDDGTDEPRYYNGYTLEDLRPELTDADGRWTGMTRRPLGIEHLALHGMQGRGVLVDWHAHHGMDKQRISFAQLRDIMEKDKVSVERGDILCLHFGFAGLIADHGGQVESSVLRATGAGLDGRDPDLLRWIDETGIAAIVADNFSVEYVPSTPAPHGHRCAGLPLHEHCLFKNGIPLGELWYLSSLAKWLRDHERSRFLLTAPPLRLPGAAGSAVTPIATV